MSYCIVQRPRANFITYEYKNTRVFVTPAYDYETAIDIAQKEIRKLAEIPRERIVFNVYVFNSQTKTREKIRISREAWGGAMDKASPGQIVNIEVLPAPSKFWNRFRRARSEERGASSKAQSSLTAPVDSGADSASWSDKGPTP
ncbi:hypothetical protein F5887DRAFT_917020 [Amanita rubescens]|nr:hypothetical protein F5887DRAFT_917020 [Amanita rubescens]